MKRSLFFSLCMIFCQFLFSTSYAGSSYEYNKELSTLFISGEVASDFYQLLSDLDRVDMIKSNGEGSLYIGKYDETYLSCTKQNDKADIVHTCKFFGVSTLTEEKINDSTVITLSGYSSRYEGIVANVLAGRKFLDKYNLILQEHIVPDEYDPEITEVYFDNINSVRFICNNVFEDELIYNNEGDRIIEASGSCVGTNIKIIL